MIEKTSIPNFLLEKLTYLFYYKYYIIYSDAIFFFLFFLHIYIKLVTFISLKWTLYLHHNPKTDGSITLSENIADNGGFKQALLAYRNFISRNGKEQLLGGYEHLSSEQLFTIAFANVSRYSFILQQNFTIRS